MNQQDRQLLSGNEAIALAARNLGIALGTGYPGTPSTEILENFSELGGRAQWAPNEKVALEVALGASFTGARTLATMKHVGLNVAADPLFTAAYTGVDGAMVVVCADDPGMASSQNEQDNRHYAIAAGIPMLEPCDSQEAYDFMAHAVEISERWNIPVLLRLTTRICHSKTVIRPRPLDGSTPVPDFVRDIKGRVMIPAYARPAHRKLRKKLAEIQAWNEATPINEQFGDDGSLGIICSGISAVHVREAAPQAKILKLGMTYPLPVDAIRKFTGEVDLCLVIEEGDPYLADSIRALGIEVDAKPEMYRFGELNVTRVRRILNGDTTPEPAPPPGKPPQLCPGCSHRAVFQALSDLDCIVAGDIGCYTLGVLPPFEAMDTCVCMGASIGVGLGLRHTLPDDRAKRVVSVIGDSTFVHSGITGLAEMVYNPPKTGHIVIILDNETTAMTGLQEHPGTGRRLDHSPATQLDYEALGRALGIPNVLTVDLANSKHAIDQVIRDLLDKGELALLIAKRPCILAFKKIRGYENAAAEQTEKEVSA